MAALLQIKTVFSFFLAEVRKFCYDLIEGSI